MKSYLDKVVEQAVVEILAAEVGVARRGLDLEHAFVDGQKGHIKSASAQVEDQHVVLLGCPSPLFVEPCKPTDDSQPLLSSCLIFITRENSHTCQL